MADDRHDEASQEGSRPKRTPPTIDLQATEISRAADGADAEEAAKPVDDPSSVGDPPVPPRASSRGSSVAISAMAGALAAALMIGVAWFAGWPASSSMPQVNQAEFGDLSNRVASVESRVSRPVASATDPAAAARIDAVEKSVASLRSELATLRGQSDKLAAAVGAISAPREAASTLDLSAITARLAAIERTARTLTAETAEHKSAAADDMPLRRVVAATLLNVSVRHGEPYAEILAASKALAVDPAALKPLEMFASSGVPSANLLCRELLAIVPKLSPAPAAATTGTGIVDRLQAGAARLVQIERTDGAAGDSANAVVARVTASALHNDVAAAKAGLNALPPADRAPAGTWIAKADAREAALAASHRFAAETMAALTKPAE